MPTVAEITQKLADENPGAPLTTTQFTQAYNTASGLPANDAENQARLQEFMTARAGIRKVQAGSAPVQAPIVTPPPEAPKPEAPKAEAPREQPINPADEYKQKLDGLNAESALAYDSSIGQLATLQANMDARTAALINNLKATYERRKEDMAKINTAVVANTNTAELRSGRARFASTISQGNIASEERAGIQRIADLDNELTGLILQAQDANDANKLKILNQTTELIKEKRDEQRQAILDQITISRNAEQDAITKSKEARDQQEFVMKTDQYKTEQATKRAEAVGATLVTLDENFEVSEASMEQVASIAQEYGIDPNIVFNSMQKQAAELRKESREERGSFFERQKFAVEQEQNNFKNYMDEQKFALEQEVFGLTKEEFDLKKKEYELKKSEAAQKSNTEIVKINGVDYEKDKTTGALTLPKVPFDAKKAQASLSAADEKINLVDSILNNSALDAVVGPYKVNRGNFGPFDKAKRQAASGAIAQLIDQQTLTALLELKAQGGTLGAISEKELTILQSAATQISKWADPDHPGEYAIDEKTFNAELNKIKGSSQRIKDAIEMEKQSQPVKPFTNFQDLYYNGTKEQKDKYKLIESDPAFKDASVTDKIEALNAAQGFTGEKGSGELFSHSVETNFPAGKEGGQCGTFAHKLVDFPPIGDSKQEKFDSVDKIGIKKGDWKPKVGDVVITNESKKYGHVAIVKEILPSGDLQLTESNFNSDERITHSRTLNPRSSVVYGAIRGKYKV